MTRSLHGIGAGPGDPELMTLRGLRLLREANCVFLPATRPGASFARPIVETYLDSSRQSIVELVCPAYRDRSAVAARWLALAGTVDDRLLEGKSGVFICEGDPSIYSTWVHLRSGIERLGAQIELHTVPGVSSVSAAAAAADMPLAIWDERLLVTPAVRETSELRTLLAQAETVALLKAGGDLDQLADSLDALGPSVQAAMVRRAGRPEEQILHDTTAMRAATPDYFTTIIVRRCNT